MCIYGSRITFVLFAPVPETGCPMWHAGLTLTLFSRMRALRCEKNVQESQLIWEVGPTRCIIEMTKEPNCEVQSVWIRSTRPILPIIAFGFRTSLPCCVQRVSRQRTVCGKRNIGLQGRRKYFDTVVTPVACFGAGVQTG